MSAGNIRIALSLSRPQLVQYLSARPADLRMRLREKELVTATEAARLADTQDSHGAVGQAQALVDILEKRTEEEIWGFMTGMEEYTRESSSSSRKTSTVGWRFWRVSN